jgi:hypothetical protein
VNVNEEEEEEEGGGEEEEVDGIFFCLFNTIGKLAVVSSGEPLFRLPFGAVAFPLLVRDNGGVFPLPDASGVSQLGILCE